MKSICVLAVSLFSVNSMALTVWYVDIDNISGNKQGVSWATAFTSIQKAVDKAVAAGASETAPAEVWVAEGIYTGVGRVVNIAGTDTENVLELTPHVHVYGGFTGNETKRGDRDWKLNETIIDGENIRRCVIVRNIDPESATLDGFTIQRGRTIPDGSVVARRGGGMYNSNSSPLVTNCTFLENASYLDGGGIFNTRSSPVLENCVFLKNSALYYGGGICNWAFSTPTLTKCSFLDNSARDYDGGVFSAYASAPELTNCTFSGNRVRDDVLEVCDAAPGTSQSNTEVPGQMSGLRQWWRDSQQALRACADGLQTLRELDVVR